MKYTVGIDLDRPVATVWAAFMRPENAKIWQPTLTNIEPVSGVPGAVGSVANLHYTEGSRSMALAETILARAAPHRFDAAYVLGNTINVCQNTFDVIDESRTRWTMACEFRFSGFMKIMALFLRGAIRRRTQQDVNRFKDALESGQLNVDPVQEPPAAA